MCGAARLLAFGAATSHPCSGILECPRAPSPNQPTCGSALEPARQHTRHSTWVQGWDNAALRQLRRRDFPPFEHPSICEGRAPNACAARFARGLSDGVLRFVEGKLLKLQARS